MWLFVCTGMLVGTGTPLQDVCLGTGAKQHQQSPSDWDVHLQMSVFFYNHRVVGTKVTCHLHHFADMSTFGLHGMLKNYASFTHFFNQCMLKYTLQLEQQCYTTLVHDSHPHLGLSCRTR